jgi:hypothetical protein
MCVSVGGSGQSQWQDHQKLIDCHISFLIAWLQINEGREDHRVTVMTLCEYSYYTHDPALREDHMVMVMPNERFECARP